MRGAWRGEPLAITSVMLLRNLFYKEEGASPIEEVSYPLSEGLPL